MKNIYILIGTRPNFIKVTRFKEFARDYDITVTLIHTGQHYDDNMANVFFDQFELRPDYFLNVGEQTPNTQIASILTKLEDLFNTIGKPDLFIVPGDVNSTLAGAIAANKMGVKLAHLESGLRSFDNKMPEEHNRIVADNLANICFVTEPSGLENIKNEGISAKVEYVGNTMIDTLVHYEPKIDKSPILNKLNLVPEKYLLLTFHRPSNVDTEESLTKLMRLLSKLSVYDKLVIPLHPRTKNKLKELDLLDRFNEIQNIIITEPLGYFEFQKLIKHAKVVITDSGGIQEETTFRKIPCLTVRENTERPITINKGSNTLVGTNTNQIVNLVDTIYDGTYKNGEIPDLWDGNATKRIFESIS